MLGVVIITCLASIVFVNAMGLWLLRNSDALRRLVIIPDLNLVRTQTSLKASKCIIPEFEGKDHLQLLQQVNNLVTKIEPEPKGDFASLYNHVMAGGGLYCSGMAALYFHALCLNRIEARLVMLRRNLFDPYDSHTTVEVRCDNQWQIYDPTFMVGFQRDEKVLGAQDIYQSLEQGCSSHIRPVKYGSGTYPAELKDYYIHWLPLFNNVFVLDKFNPSRLVKLPPWRYWLGPIAYCQQSTCDRNFHLKFHQDLYLGVVLILPILLIFLGLGLMAWISVQYSSF